MLKTVKKAGIFIVAAAVMILFLFLSRDNSTTADKTLNQVNPSQTDDPPDDTEDAFVEDVSIYVDIKGAVNNPGVFEANPGERVNDMIQRAGGFTNEADQTQVNLAQKVHDEMSIIVPTTGDVIENVFNNEIGSEKVHLNSASKEEIETLSGIGPSKAEAIIAYREENGLFQSLEDLLNVSGIGEKTIEQLEDSIQVP
ncbi:ComE operon protein 1 [Oceanobacillus picturae]|uniref:ComE operon protein 1 n=1 Tax=Oceanobacillus picturae TaxID=171693 RepID=W9AFX3_9BACI|nr:helix-hairpin-helix domain-containing protein [Oceanobacillus picturae]GAQ19340.1 ComE operon protein 1 [Oceanobacillus picturae]CDO01832.1 ComE operon protein 1 [Oceanobacillus picturae]